MKILHWAVVFIAIILPFSITCRVKVNSRYAALKDEVRINNAIDTATKDAIDQIIAVSGFDYDEEFGDVINITPALAQETVNTFFHTLAVNYNIPYKITDTTMLGDNSEDSYIKNYFAPYVPAVVVVAYDGFYVYSQNQNPSLHTYSYTLSTKIPYTISSDEGYTIGYTLGNDIYLYADGKCYSGRLLHNSYAEVETAYNEICGILGGTPEVDDIAMLAGNDVSVIMYALKNRSGGNKINFEDNIFPSSTTTNFLQDYTKNASGEYEFGKFHESRRKVIIDIISSCLREEINVDHNRFKNILGVNYNFYLPEISELDWVNTINDITVMAFVQGIPVGTLDGQYFNSYALGGSQIVKREYLYGMKYNGTPLYHQHDCPELKMHPDEYDYIFITPDDAIAAGYHACMLCN